MADVMSAMATQPGVWTKVELANHLGKQRSDVQRTVQYFEQLGWLQPTRARERNIRFEPTDGFWTDFHDMFEVINMDDCEQTLHDEALQERIKMESPDLDRMDYMFARANFLGRTVVLGESYDLRGEVGWFEANHGWRSLITIEALGAASLNLDAAS